MLKSLQIVVLTILMVLMFISCSSTHPCEGDHDYRITLYSAGGFTGGASGVTITCDGWAKYWQRQLNSSKQVTDSIRLDDDQGKSFRDMVHDPKLFSYQHDSKGNLTTYLIIEEGKRHNQISFADSNPPEDMPASIKSLIVAVNALHKQ